MSALNAAALASLAGWIEDRLSNERADRQTICEDVAAQLRDMAAAVRESRKNESDVRVTAAREFLDGARRRKVTELPPSLLIRECAELRRLLGQVLDVIAAGVCLDDDQAATVLAALDDAAGHIRERAANCPECAASPADLCDGCAGRLARSDAYDDLARQIGDKR